ncbi:cytotoxic translational repressor of toxin-antitoxin stability system [Desulfocurvibacter africanus]|uniref:type II toxin-antitoxin system RelE family toxin n=1 Tax=Desulfocurvibacter africanus TaxID=873 RepID=UPI002FDA2217
MTWTVEFTAKAAKQKTKLPKRIAERLDALRRAIEFNGPLQPTMPHFGKLKNRPGEAYHCHLNKGRPTYVAVWQVLDKVVCLVEVTYVGTHEKAPY